MGLNFRKSFTIGKFLRINLSKSGIGYSVGVPGARISRNAKGKTKTTYSIPGTGISYTPSTAKTKSTKKEQGSSFMDTVKQILFLLVILGIMYIAKNYFNL